MANEKYSAEIGYTADEVSEAVGFALDKKKDGLYSREETDKLLENKVGSDKVYIDDRGNTGFGDVESHKFYGEKNFSSGSGNKLGSRGYHIISFSGINGGAGFYYVDGTPEDAVAIQTLIVNGEEIYITIRNDEWKDSWCKILSASYSTNTKLCLEVESNFYTNTNTIEEQVYSEDNEYSSQGVDKNYPELGYAVQNQITYIFIVGHPEFGSFDMCSLATAVGIENISQNDFTLTSGYNNVSSGRYSVAIGNDNSSGYCSVSMGRSNKGAKALASVLLGDFNKVLKNVENVILMGRHLLANFWNQIILGSWNNNKEDNVLEIGNGIDDAHRSNVFEVTKVGGIRTLEEYFPGSNLGTYDLSELQKEGNYGNFVKDKLDTTNYVRITNITTADDGKGSVVTVPVEPEVVYYKRTTQGTSKSRYFSYIYINADPQNTNGGLGLEANTKYMLGFDIEIISADNPTQIQVAPFTLNYGADNPSGLAGVVGSIKIGKNHIYCPFDISENNKEIGVYFKQKGDTYGDDQCSFIVSNVRLIKLLETKKPIETLAIDKYGNYFCSYRNSGAILINAVHNEYDGSPDYIGYTDSTAGVNYIGSIKSPDTSECSFRVVSPDELSYRIITDERLENKSNKQTMTAHTENRKNPHGVIAGQVGAYTKEEVDKLLNDVQFKIASLGFDVAGLPTYEDVYTKIEVDDNFDDVNTTLNKHEEALKNPSYEEEIKLTEVTTAIGGTHVITDNSVSGDGTEFHIDVSGNIKFKCKVDQNSGSATVMGTKIGGSTGVYEYSFEGGIENGFTVSCSFVGVTFTEFVKIMYVTDAIGDIDTALDEILAIKAELWGDAV